MKHEPRFFLQNNALADKNGAPVFFKSYTAKPDNAGHAAIDGNGNLIRVQLCWNMAEHDGPELYDEAFLAGLRDSLKPAVDAELTVLLEAQPAGCGTGAMPGWAMAAAGFDAEKLRAAAPGVRQAADNVMAALFLYGNTVAPGLTAEDCAIQDFLQDHFIAAMRHTARRLKDLPCIAGFMLPAGITPLLPPPEYAALLEQCSAVLRPDARLAQLPSATADAGDSTARFMYRFISAFAAKHAHFIMFAPEIPAADGYFEKLTAYQPPLPVCRFSAVSSG